MLILISKIFEHMAKYWKPCWGVCKPQIWDYLTLKVQMWTPKKRLCVMTLNQQNFWNRFSQSRKNIFQFDMVHTVDNIQRLVTSMLFFYFEIFCGLFNVILRSHFLDSSFHYLHSTFIFNINISILYSSSRSKWYPIFELIMKINIFFVISNLG